MAATKTVQVYLTDAQFEYVRQYGQKTGKSMAKVLLYFAGLETRMSADTNPLIIGGIQFSDKPFDDTLEY